MIRLRELASDVHELARLPSIAPSHNVEHALHELCHAATLGLDFGAEDGFVTRSVSRTMASMSPRAADWNEIWTCAAELRAAELLGLSVGSARFVVGYNVQAMSTSKAVSLIRARIDSEAAYGHARRAILGARVAIQAFMTAFPWYPDSPQARGNKPASARLGGS